MQFRADQRDSFFHRVISDQAKGLFSHLADLRISRNTYLFSLSLARCNSGNLIVNHNELFLRKLADIKSGIQNISRQEGINKIYEVLTLINRRLKSSMIQAICIISHEESLCNSRYTAESRGLSPNCIILPSPAGVKLCVRRKLESTVSNLNNCGRETGLWPS
jgi:hypothetical protein